MRYFVLEQSKFEELYNIKKTDAQFSSDSRSQIPSESETVGTHTAETGTEGTAEWNEQRRRTPPQQATSSHLKLLKKQTNCNFQPSQSILSQL